MAEEEFNISSSFIPFINCPAFEDTVSLSFFELILANFISEGGKIQKHKSQEKKL